MRLKVGSNGQAVTDWQQWFHRKYASYAPPVDGYYGNADRDATRILQGRLGIAITGEFDDVTAARSGYPGAVTIPAHRPIWIYTAPGSGADWWLGPSFDLGERCKNVLHLNHQPLAFTKGGYLGFMGGDPGFSYNEVTYDQYKSLEYNLDHNPDAQEALRQAASGVPAAKIEFEMHASGYSQSADGMEDALEILFGDGGFIHPGDPARTPSSPGKYRSIRDSLKLVVQFGNPSTKGTGIAAKVRPAWLDAKIRNVNYPNDFYAVAPDEIRRDFYEIIVQADMSLPFFVHVLKIAGPVILQTIPILGGFLGPLAPLVIAGATGLNAFLPLLTGLVGQAQSAGDEEVDRKLIDMLSVTGLIKNVPGLIGLIAALPGLQAHGGYPFDPVMMDRAYGHIAGFRR